ncbi:MAG TPA: TIGR01548 family HAD-type hydrolase [Bryobacteraceae bacterium]|jgi:HAD superfamily hydrolase (TIGR01548 family)|nr:TIGR01548 family HAD-type hydrolase [Bryobacteraceae bacterium]
MNKPLLVFDMDGVLVDVTESYRETIAQTVNHFTGARPAHEKIQELKNAGGWNDDWKLSHHMVREAGIDAAFDDVKSHFQDLFRGNDNQGGLMEREQWVARPGVLEKLSERFRFAVFTGRPKDEAELTLRRFAPEIVFDPIIGMYDVSDHKPAPEGLLKILEANCECEVFYVGDTIDDARAAKAAKVPFIGIAAPSNPLYLDLVFIFQAEKAYAIVDDINYLEEVFAS